MTLYGILAEFDSPEQLLAAARAAREDGFRDVQAYTPFPIEELTEFVTVRRRHWVPAIVLIGGILGGLTGFLMQVYAAGVSYPLNIGGRPLFSWPSFIPITFELTVLGAALAGVLGMLVLNGLPRPFHPVFTVPEFRRATDDKFFLCIKASGKGFDAGRAKSFFEGRGAESVTEIDVTPGWK